MDDLTLLRELEADTPPPTSYAEHLARVRLRLEIERERERARNRPPIGRLAVAGVAAAAAAAVVIVGVDPRRDVEEPRVQLTSTAAALELAARAVADDHVALPRDDQYIYIKQIVEETPVSGGKRETFVDESWLAVGQGQSLTSERGRQWMASDWFGGRYDDIAHLPTDPAQLLLSVRAWPDDGRASNEPMSADDYESAYMFLMSLLRRGRIMPAELRSAAFGALARIPGVEIVDDRLDPRGPRGLAIRRRGDAAWPQADVVARGSYDYLGMRDTYVTTDGVRVDQVVRRVDTGVADRLRQRP